jgi:hypothetical protein
VNEAKELQFLALFGLGGEGHGISIAILQAKKEIFRRLFFEL